MLDIYKDEGLFERSAELSQVLGGRRALAEGPAGRHRHPQPRASPAASTWSRKDAVGARGFDTFVKAFELGLMVRQAGDTIAMSPPLVIEKSQIDEIIDLCGKAIKATA